MVKCKAKFLQGIHTFTQSQPSKLTRKQIKLHALFLASYCKPTQQPEIWVTQNSTGILLRLLLMQLCSFLVPYPNIHYKTFPFHLPPFQCLPLVLLSLLRVGPEKSNIKMKRSSSIVIFPLFNDTNISTSYFKKDKKKKLKKSHIFSPTLYLLREEWLIIEILEQGVALLLSDVEVIFQWCSPEESHISHWSDFSHTTCSQHRCYYSSYKIISAPHFGFCGNIFLSLQRELDWKW